MEDWNAALADGTEPPDSTQTEVELVVLWNATPSGSACELFAGAALGVATLVGIYNETGEAAYLEPVTFLLSNLDQIQYDCLIAS
jgi:hypothetical protein